MLHEQVIRFVVKAPLADHQVRAGVLHPLNHVLEFLLLVLPQPFVFLHARDVKFVLCLGTGRLEWTCEDRDLRILDGVGHLRVGEVFVDEHALDERNIGERAAHLPVNLDHVERHVFPLEIRDGKHCIDSNLGKLVVLL